MKSCHFCDVGYNISEWKSEEIAFGIKFSIDSGCRGDVLFEAKTPELARHYEKDFHARPVATLNSGGPQRYMLADEDAWNLFEKFLAEEEP